MLAPWDRDTVGTGVVLIPPFYLSSRYYPGLQPPGLHMSGARQVKMELRGAMSHIRHLEGLLTGCSERRPDVQRNEKGRPGVDSGLALIAV